MNAAIITAYEAPITIGRVDTPALTGDSVLIAVHAASINPIDDILRLGKMKDVMPLTFPHVMGYDVSGVVVAVGADVTQCALGDAVFARPSQNDAGAIAEFARVKGSELAMKPATLSHAQAASVPLAGLTAWQALITRGKLKAGDKVLIHAGSGGVGSFAIQIAKHIGAHIATTCSGHNIDLVKRLGADVVIDHTTDAFDQQLSDYDLVFDMLGGETMARSFTVLKPGGTMISIKGQDTENLAKKFGVHFEWFLMEPDGAMLGELGALIDTGAVQPVIGKTFTMEQSAAAYEELANGHSVGKIVVTISDSAANPETSRP
ncbi:NADP-dependent oxidoreductase [Gemmatimonas sp.]|uniref:NADP-dependent oxidoreductase n=2 Tax=Gemmatimonas sp. TaxID=1962908 RepID=UPI00286EAD8C|nr:NADP-dependent oxidoreductase [Gemmatimonas sp.]